MPLLPRWLLLVSWAASIGALAVTFIAGHAAVRAGYPPEGIESADVDDICKPALDHAWSQPYELRDGWRCDYQKTNRGKYIAKAREELALACGRRHEFLSQLEQMRPGARTWLKEEETQIRRAAQRLGALMGPAVYPAQYKLLAGVAFNLALALATMLLAAFHGHRVKIPKIDKQRKIVIPFVVISLITFAVAAVVTARESLDPEKIDFDGNSYCMVPSSFWWAHSSIPLMSVVVGAQLALGWYMTRSEHVPELDKNKMGWGVGPYVFFLELWSFAAIVISAGVAAFWFRAFLASSPVTSARTEGMLGFGALGVTVVLVLRFVRNAFVLRAKYESFLPAKADQKDLPPDPTAGLIGEPWKLPVVFAAAFGVAYKLIELADVARLVDGSP